MARPRPDDSRKAPPRRGGGGTWFVLFALVAGVVALLVFAPGVVRDVLGGQAPPSDLGDEPTEAVDTDGSTAARNQQELAARPVSIDGSELAKAPQREPETETTAPAQPERGLDDQRADQIIARAESAYRDFDWDSARSLARQIRQLEVSPELAVRAGDIVRGADALEEVFSKLGTKDELVRALETHPKLVTITHRGQDEDVLPIVDTHGKQPPDTDDPVGWVQGQLKTTGSVTVMTLKRIAYPLSAADVADVRPADVEAVIAEKRREFEAKLDKLESGDMAKDALAWYEAAKYAYRNRLDELVTAMLDQALELDPLLAQTIKEDKAQEVFLKMTQQLENDNRAAAAGWKGQLDKYYQDTSIYPQAVAYYQGNMDQLKLAQTKAAEQRREQRQRARDERLARAKALEDEAKVKEIEQEEEAVDLFAGNTNEDTDVAAVAATGDVSEADTYFNQGAEIYSRAQSLGVTDERDRLYSQAEKEFSKAMALYEKLGMDAKMVQANQYRYACIKYRRAF